MKFRLYLRRKETDKGQFFMLPNFICIGPGRAGTSWLYEILLEHPEVCMAKNIKETQFFNANYDKGVQWYEKFFEGCGSYRACGEISNLYIVDPMVASRIKGTIPDCKILICLRNPYDRILSVYSFKLREGALNCSFGEALRKMPEIINVNRYYSLIRPYYNLFGSKDIHFIFFDDIINNPHELCRALFSFLGVDENFAPTCIKEKINQAIIPRFPMASLITKGAARLMRAMEIHKPLTYAKRSNKIKKLFFKEHDYKKENIMTKETRAMLDPILLPEIEKLEVLIGESLDKWRPQ
jgi:hypothetical protein